MNYKESLVTVPINLGTSWLDEFIKDKYSHIDFIDFESTVDVKFSIIYDNGRLEVKPFMVSDMMLVSNKGVTIEDGVMQIK